MQLTDILYEKRDAVAIATFNRPDSLNAFRTQTYHDLNLILEDVKNDDAVRVLILTGSGRAFCAGEDLKEMNSTLDRLLELKDTRDRLHSLQDITRRVVSLPKIVIAAINGVTVGFGCELSIASDIRLAADSAWFYFSEVQRGLMVTNGVLYLLPRLVGQGHALEMMVSGDRIPAQKALEVGLVNHVVPQAELLDLAQERARTIAANAPIPVRSIKQIIQRSYDLDLDGIMQLEIDATMECLTSEDLKEGIHAFIEKRTPIYKGK